MKAFLVVLATALFAQGLANTLGDMEGNMEDAHYNCPMIDIDLYGHDLDKFYDIGSWQECAHICNIAYTSNCKFWTFGYGNCGLKSSDAGMRPTSGAVSGERGCTG